MGVNKNPITKLLIIDSQVNEWQTLVSDAKPDTAVLVIYPNADGLSQITDYLTAWQARPEAEGFTTFDSIHIVSHGSAGSLLLGASSLNNTNLANHADELVVIGQALSPNGDLLLYGCDVAQGETGQQFIQTLAEYTGTDVAASVNLTGHSDLGGDWTLEQASGQIEATTLQYTDYTATFDITPLGLALQDQTIFDVGRYIEFGSLFSILSYGDGALALNDVAGKNKYTSFIDEGFNDDYRSFFTENQQLGKSWELLSDKASANGNWNTAWGSVLNSWLGGNTHAAFTSGGLYNAYLDSTGSLSTDQYISQTDYTKYVTHDPDNGATNEFPNSYNWLGDSNALLAQSFDSPDDGTLVLTFRGTDEFDGAFTGGQTWVGDGAFLHYEAFRPLIDAAYTYASDPSNYIKHIVVSGHSLGGAMADIFTLVDASRFAAIDNSDLTIVSLASPGLDPDTIFDGLANFGFGEKYDRSLAFPTSAIDPNLGLFETNLISEFYHGFAHDKDRVYFAEKGESYLLGNGLGVIDPWLFNANGVIEGNTNFDATVLNLPTITNWDVDYKNIYYDFNLIDPSSYTPYAKHGFGADHNAQIYWRDIHELYSSPLSSYYVDQNLVFGRGLFAANQSSWFKPDILPSLLDDQIGLGVGPVEDNGLSWNLGGNDFLLGLEGNDNLQGKGGDDLLDGGAGDDTLDGGSGMDRLSGGAGNDTYIIDDDLDQIFENANQGINTVKASINYTLPTNVENLTLVLDSDINGTGNDLSNIITGNDGHNFLRGLRGDDTLVAGGGFDVLEGGDGLDTLIAWDGYDTLKGGNASDSYQVTRLDNTLSDPPFYSIYDESGGGDELVINDIAAFIQLKSIADLNFRIVNNDLWIDLDLVGSFSNDNDEGRIIIQGQGLGANRIESLRLVNTDGDTIGISISLPSVFAAVASYGDSDWHRVSLSNTVGEYGSLALGARGEIAVENPPFNNAPTFGKGIPSLTEVPNPQMFLGHSQGEWRNSDAFAVIKADGSVVTWGFSEDGGDSSAVADQIDGSVDVTQIYSAGSAFAALRIDGSVITWGYYYSGGDSSAVTNQLDGTVDVTQIFSTSNAFAALRTDGSVVTWGYSEEGGDSSAVADQINGTVDVTQIFSTGSAFAALRTDGSVITWGAYYGGGDSSAVANQIDGTIDVMQIYTSGTDEGGAFAALRADGSVVTWGHYSGSDSSAVSNQINGTVDVTAVCSTEFAFAALRADGSVVTWGDSRWGGDSSAVSNQLDGTLDVIHIYSTRNAFAALRTDGSVVTWGGDGGDSSAVADKINGNVKQIYSTIESFAALRTDGSVVTWGYSDSGGDSSAVASQLDGTVDVTKIYSTDRLFAALRIDGSVVTWDDEYYYGSDSSAVAGQLDGTVDVTQIYTTQYNSFAALHTDGSVVTWGNEYSGGDSNAVADQLRSGVVSAANIYTDEFYYAPQDTLGGTVTFNRGGMAVILDNDVTLSDIDLDTLNGGAGNYSGAKLTLARHGGANAEDVFSSSTFVGTDIVASGTSIGNFTQAAGSLTATFNTNATQALVNSVLRKLAYTNTADTPPDSVRIDWLVNDKNNGSQGTGGELTATGWTTVMIMTPNNPPVGNGTTVTLLEDGSYTLTSADFGFTDPNDTPPNTLLAVKLATLQSAGSLKLNGVAVMEGQFVSAFDIAANKLVFTPAANGNGKGYASFTFQVQDDGGMVNGGVDLDQSPNTFTFNVSSVSDAPAGADKAITLLEDSSYTLTSADLGFTDHNDTSPNDFLAVKLASLPSAGSLKLNGATVTEGQFVSAFDIATNKLVFTPAANGNGTGYASFTFQVQDDGGMANGGVDLDATPNTLSFNVTSVNNAPAGADKAVTLLEDGSHTLTTADFGFTDPVDNPANDLLAVKITTLPNAGSLKLNGVAVTAGQSVSAADIDANKLVFAPVANANGSNYASLTFQVQDNGGTANGGVDLDPTQNTLTFNVTHVNDAPAGTDKAITLEEYGAYILTAADFGFTDPNDSPPNALLSVKIATLPNSGLFKLNGAAVNSCLSISASDINAGKLTFTPALNPDGSSLAAFTFQVQDDGGTANGGVELDPLPKTLTFDAPPAYTAPSVELAGESSVNEGSSYALSVGSVTGAVSHYIFHWGDGNTDQMLTADQLNKLGNNITHTYVDGMSNPTIIVDLVDEQGIHVNPDSKSLTVNNITPTISLTGAAHVMEDSTYTLKLGTVNDPGQDTVSSYSVNWGDGLTDHYTAAQVTALSGQVVHIYADGPAHRAINIGLTDEDGTFANAGALSVDVYGAVKLGDAPASLGSNNKNGWIDAWAKPGVGIQHKADITNASEAWSAVSKNSLGSSLLSGGDIFGGDLGVSGQSAATSAVKQEIDGREALRITLPELAGEATINLSRFYQHDDGSQVNSESGLLQAFKASALVGELNFTADSATGNKSINLQIAEGFDSLVLTAGDYNDSHFAYGAYAKDDGSFGTDPYLAGAALHGSDFLVDVVLIGVQPDQYV